MGTVRPDLDGPGPAAQPEGGGLARPSGGTAFGAVASPCRAFLSRHLRLSVLVMQLGGPDDGLRGSSGRGTIGICGAGGPGPEPEQAHLQKRLIFNPTAVAVRARAQVRVQARARISA